MYEARKLNGKEMAVVEYMMAIESRMRVGGDDLHKYLDEYVPGGWTRFRQIGGMLRKLLVQMENVMSPRDLRHMDNLYRYSEVAIRIKAPVKVPEHVLLYDKDVQTLVDTVMRGECTICLREGREMKECKLRAALMGIAPPYNLDDRYGCPYRDVAVEKAQEPM